MKGRLSERQRAYWDQLLKDLGSQFGATVQLAEVVGKRWHYLAGETASEAGLLGGIRRQELGNGYGAIIFPHQPSFEDAVCEEIYRQMRRGFTTATAT